MGGYYSVNLSLTNKKCLVVGGGKVAARKVQSLLACSANVYVVSPELTPLLIGLANDNRIFYLPREYNYTDLLDCFLVISATDDVKTNQKVASDCMSKNILVNVVDCPDLCNFFVPAVVQKGDLSISISTGGKSPMLARKIRAELAELYGDEYAELLSIMGELRKEITAKVSDAGIRREIYKKIVYSDILNLLAEGEHEMVKGRIANVLTSCGIKS